MAVQVGYASQSEYYSTTGNAGDQPGWEVKIGPWYYFGQTVVLRFKDRALAKKAVNVCKKICNNNHVGYDQLQRTTLFAEMERVGWDPDKITKNVETDCSAMVAVILNAVGIKVSKDLWTGNMKKALQATGKFTTFTGATYCKSDNYCRYGDIILNEQTHVVMALQDGPKTKELDKANSTGKETGKVAEKGSTTVKAVQPSHSGMVIAKAGLKVRNAPNLHGRWLRTLKYGQKVYCYGYTGAKKGGGLEWWKISGTANEYVCKDFVGGIKKL